MTVSLFNEVVMKKKKKKKRSILIVYENTFVCEWPRLFSFILAPILSTVRPPYTKIWTKQKNITHKKMALSRHTQRTSEKRHLGL